MFKPIYPKIGSLPLAKSISYARLRWSFLLIALACFRRHRSPWRGGLLPIPLILAIFALLPPPRTFAVTPAPDGGYTNGNTAEGTTALFSLTTGEFNTANGFQALYSNTTGNANTAIGAAALESNTMGNENTATGVNALIVNSTGNDNTANGVGTLFSNTTGSQNTASGANALKNNATGNENTAMGSQALLDNTSGGDNTATGISALSKNTMGSSNTASGAFSLFNNIVGSFNTASGENALRNDTGSSNTAMGIQALNNNTSGSLNTAVGALAGQNLTTGNNNIDIGANVVGLAGESGKIRIGKQGTQNGTFIAGIFGVTMTGSPVVVNSSGKLGVGGTSSIRFKKAVKPMDNASEGILSLKPVTFRYKEEIDPEGIPQFGLVAEEVEKVNPDLITRDEDGKLSTVRYEAVNAMLLNEFLKEHRKVQDLEKQVAALTAGLQKITAQLDSTNPVRRVGAHFRE